MSLFRAFFLSMVYVFTMQKISLNWAPLQDFLNIVLNFGKTCFQKNVVNIFWCKIWVITISKSVKFLILWVLLNENECLLLSTFSTFQTPLTNLTNSALICLGLLGLFQITTEWLWMLEPVSEFCKVEPFVNFIPQNSMASLTP